MNKSSMKLQQARDQIWARARDNKETFKALKSVSPENDIMKIVDFLLSIVLFEIDCRELEAEGEL